MLIVNGINIEKNRIGNRKNKKEKKVSQPIGFENAEVLSPEQSINKKIIGFSKVNIEN
jgi:hypothetical protein